MVTLPGIGSENESVRNDISREGDFNCSFDMWDGLWTSSLCLQVGHLERKFT